MNLIIVRGLPGSGKSTFAHTIADETFEADKYFVNPDTGIYHFDIDKLSDAHVWCQAQVADSMMKGTHIIAVSNTFVRKWEMNAYLTLAKTFGYRVHEVTMSGPVRESIHGVPEEVIERMKRTWNT